MTTHSPAAQLVGGERVDRSPPKGFLQERMMVVRTEPRAAQIQAQLERARKRRGR